MLLIMPTTALGMEPSDLFSKMNAVPTSTFSLTLHAHAEDMYVSVWSKGTMAVSSSFGEAQATVDVNYQGMKMRFKGDIKMNADGVFLLVREASGNYDSDFARSTYSAYTKKWLRIAGPDALELFGYGNMMMIEEDLAYASDMFTVQAVPNAQGTTYIVQLTPDAAAGMAQELFTMLGGDRPLIQDFFPWRALAESIQFEIKVNENPQGTLTSRTANINLTGENSYFTFSSSETFSSSLPTVATPDNATSIEEVMQSFMGLDPFSTNSEMEDLYYEEMEWDSYNEGMLEFGEEWNESGSIEGSWYDDYSDDEYQVWSGDCWSAPSAQLVAMQRSGECPVEKISRRLLNTTR